MIVTRLDATDAAVEEFPTRMATFLFRRRKGQDFFVGGHSRSQENSLQACYEASSRAPSRCRRHGFGACRIDGGTGRRDEATKLRSLINCYKSSVEGTTPVSVVVVPTPYRHQHVIGVPESVWHKSRNCWSWCVSGNRGATVLVHALLAWACGPQRFVTQLRNNVGTKQRPCDGPRRYGASIQTKCATTPLRTGASSALGIRAPAHSRRSRAN